LRGCFGLW